MDPSSLLGVADRAFAGIGWLLRRLSIGRRLRLRPLLPRLMPPTTRSYVQDFLREAPALQTRVCDGLIWIWPEAFLQIVFDGESSVMTSITTRSKRFKPRLPNVTLGRTTFEELAPNGPGEVLGFIGAQHYLYAEAHYFGRPGLYRTYVYAVNDAGYTDGGDVLSLIEGLEAGTTEFPMWFRDGSVWPSDATQNSRLLEIRKSVVPNTLTVVAPSAPEDEDLVDLSTGVDPDHVMHLR